MDERTLRVLEFDKITEYLKTFTVSSLGKTFIDEMVPLPTLSEAEFALKETADAEACILKRGNPPLVAINDIRASLKRLELGTVLNMSELLRIEGILRSARTLKKYFLDIKVLEESNLVGSIIEALCVNRGLEDDIGSAIISEEEISDSASPALRSIRRQIRSAQDSVKDSINSIIHSAKYQKYMQDAIVTIRGDRYVVPVKAEYKSEIDGLVHDASGSGATLFIEPYAVVEANNKVKQLKIQEADEINRILAELSSKCADFIDELHTDVTLLGRLDFVFAKGKMSIELNCTTPKLNEDGRIVIKKGRHPLLDKKKVVPIDFIIGDSVRTMIITGPNTGGKTVTLKTVGLFTLMAQAGLNIPAVDGTEISIFEDVFADIGDEQSIEQSLSTFSSHMSNIVKLMERANDRSLVLLDELGAGTDPTEGAALAIAILETLLAYGAISVATTHYSELKEYAISSPSVQNASCEFDVTTLRPTYRLMIGVPGRSNAFAICSRLGLSDTIIDRSRQLLSEEAVKFDDMMVQLEERRISAEKERLEAENMRREAEALKQDVSKRNLDINQKREELLRSAREEAREIVDNAKKSADSLVADIKKIKVTIEENHADEILKENLKVAEDKRVSIIRQADRLDEKLSYRFISSNDSIETDAISPDKIKKGDSVLVGSLGQFGVVESLPNKNGEVRVRMGVISMNVGLGDLRLATNDDLRANGGNTTKNQAKGSRASKHSNSRKSGIVSVKGETGTSTGINLAEKRMRATMEIDIRGSSVDEGCDILEKFIDDAYLAGTPEICIIHGKGTGVLRDGVQSYLRRNPHVKSFRTGTFGEGENGVTIASLKS